MPVIQPLHLTQADPPARLILAVKGICQLSSGTAVYAEVRTIRLRQILSASSIKDRKLSSRFAHFAPSEAIHLKSKGRARFQSGRRRLCLAECLQRLRLCSCHYERHRGKLSPIVPQQSRIGPAAVLLPHRPAAFQLFTANWTSSLLNFSCTIAQRFLLRPVSCCPVTYLLYCSRSAPPLIAF